MKHAVSQRGFTLVELAIVMVIIGLLVGAVLKGQAMIEDAKQKRLVNDIQGISAAYFTYYDRYNALPGDDSAGNSRWAAVADGDADGEIDGNGATPDSETEEAWQAMRYAGLLSGDPAATGTAALPNHPYGGKFGLDYRSFGAAVGSKNYILAASMPGSVAETVDIKFDDGAWDTGTVQGSAAYTNATVDLYYAL